MAEVCRGRESNGVWCSGREGGRRLYSNKKQSRTMRARPSLRLRDNHRNGRWHRDFHVCIHHSPGRHTQAQHLAFRKEVGEAGGSALDLGGVERTLVAVVCPWPSAKSLRIS